MIYIFVGESYFRKNLINTRKQAFAKKYDENNIIHIKNYLDFDIDFYNQNLLSTGFFSTKNLFIIDELPISIGEEDANTIRLQEYFIDILPKIKEENIVIFNNSNIDKKSRLFKEILKYGEIKDFSIKDENDLKQKLQEIYKNKISPQVINKIIKLKGLNFLSIINEFDKILITKNSVSIDDLNNVSKDIEISIFDIINDILALDIKNSILKIRELNNFLDNFYLFYNNLISNLRTYFYIFILKDLGFSSNKIIELLELGNKSFLVSKNYKISKCEFEKIYKNLILIDSKMKTGRLIGSEKQDLIYEIEKCLIILK